MMSCGVEYRTQGVCFYMQSLPLQDDFLPVCVGLGLSVGARGHVW